MSTEKQLENIGKVVKEVKVLKSGVKVTFEDGDSVLLDVNSYVNGERLYKGKELSYEKVETLKRAEDDAKYYSYVLKLVASRPYSSKKLIDKLVNVKEASYKKRTESHILLASLVFCPAAVLVLLTAAAVAGRISADVRSLCDGGTALRTVGGSTLAGDLCRLGAPCAV